MNLRTIALTAGVLTGLAAQAVGGKWDIPFGLPVSRKRNPLRTVRDVVRVILPVSLGGELGTGSCDVWIRSGRIRRYGCTDAIDQLKDVPGSGAGTVTVIIVACAVATAALGGFRFFNALDERRGLSIALVVSLAAADAAALISAFIPGYGLLLLIPAVVAGLPAVLMLSRDVTQG